MPVKVHILTRCRELNQYLVIFWMERELVGLLRLPPCCRMAVYVLCIFLAMGWYAVCDLAFVVYLHRTCQYILFSSNMNMIKAYTVVFSRSILTELAQFI